MLNRLKTTFLMLLAGILLSACSGEEYDPTKEWTAEDFYDEAKSALNAGEFQTTIKHLETLEARFPFDPYAKQAQLDIAYSYYKFDEPEIALSSVDRFVRLHPRDPNIDYALYLKGLINFNRGRGLLDQWFPHDMSKHDGKVLTAAFDDFSTLVRRFPDSHYAGDAHQRLIYLRNKLAEKEIDQAHYYIDRGTWLAAANRASDVILKFPQSVWRDAALDILVQAYTELGLQDLAADTRKIRSLNSGVASPRSREVELSGKLDQPPKIADNHGDS